MTYSFKANDRFSLTKFDCVVAPSRTFGVIFLSNMRSKTAKHNNDDEGRKDGRRSKHLPPGANVKPVQARVKMARMGNCAMCARAGRIGQRCGNLCRENDPLANEWNGRPEPNPEARRNHAFCTYKAVMMPDETTKLSAEWYEMVVVEGSTPDEGSAIDPAPLPRNVSKNILLRGSVHHRLVLSYADSENIVFPPGNEVGDETAANSE